MEWYWIALLCVACWLACGRFGLLWVIGWASEPARTPAERLARKLLICLGPITILACVIESGIRGLGKCKGVRDD